MNARALRGYAALAAVIAAGGCMLVVPVEDAPPEGAGASAGDGGRAGSATGGNAGTTGGDSAGAGGDVTVPPGPCTTNAECSRALNDEPGRCVDGACIRLLSPECPRVFDIDDSRHPDAVFFGAYVNLGPSNNIEQSTAMSIYRMARDEFDSENVPGIPGGADGPRPLVMIVCDQRSEAVDASMAHLIDEVQVPAVLASLEVGDLQRAFAAYRDRDVFFLSPFGASTRLSELREDGLVWTMLGSPADLAPAYAAVLARIEADIRARAVDPNPMGNPVDATHPLKIATVGTPDAFSEELVSEVTPALRYNGGLDPLENAAIEPDAYVHFELDPSTPDSLENSIAEAATGILAAAPHVVISFADPNFVESEDIEQGLLSRIESNLRPHYVFSPLNADQLETSIAAQVRTARRYDDNAHRRFIGIGAEPAQDLEVYREFELRLRQSFPNADPRASNLYDAFYFLAYAMAGATSAGDFGGREIASVMRRLTSRSSSALVFRTDPRDSARVFDTLAMPRPDIQLMGTLGPPNFIPERGIRTQLGSVSCFRPFLLNGNPVVAFDVLTYDPATDDPFDGDASDACFDQPWAPP